jgi:dihydrofolate synthase/folylpolyglutamate synthase
VAGVVEAMAPVVDVWFAASLPPPRGLSAAALGDLVEAAVGVRPAEFGTVAQACAAAQAEAVDGDRIVVFGSFLTVGPGLTALAAD